jgi:hypothetical protein
MLSVSRLYSISDRLINDYEALGGMKSSTDNQSTQGKPAPVPFCPGRSGGKAVTNSLSYGMATLQILEHGKTCGYF